MSMMRGLFQPGAGSHFEEYNIAVASAAMYPGDWIQMNIGDAPAAQGVTAGEHRDKSLGTSDWIECRALDTTSGFELCRLGCLAGKGIDAVSSYTDLFTDTSIVAANGDHVVFMQFGIHPNAGQLDSGNATEELAASATDFEAGNAATPAYGDVGINLTASATYGRAAAADTEGAIALVRCR